MTESRPRWSEIPSNVRWFVYLWIAFSVWGLGGLIRHSAAIWPTLNAHQQSSQLGLLAAMPLIIAMWSGLVWWAAVWRSNRARWLLLILFAMSVFDEYGRALIMYLVLHRISPVLTWLNALSTVIGGASFLLLYTGNARGWFRPVVATQQAQRESHDQPT